VVDEDREGDRQDQGHPICGQKKKETYRKGGALRRLSEESEKKREAMEAAM